MDETDIDPYYEGTSNHDDDLAGSSSIIVDT